MDAVLGTEMGDFWVESLLESSESWSPTGSTVRVHTPVHHKSVGPDA